MKFANDEQFKAFLKSEAKRLGISVGNAYNTYFARLLLERINNNSLGILAVKGSFSEYAHIKELVRPITDVDLVSLFDRDYALTTLYKALYDNNDEFEMELVREPYQTPTGIYKINIIVHFGKIAHCMNIDFQEKAKTLYDIDYKVINRIFKGDIPFYVCTPPIEAYIAEKLCIVAENTKEDVINTRVKDFYDIWKLLTCDYNANKLEAFFVRMIEDRQKMNPKDLNTDFLNQEYIEKHQETWDNIKNKYEFLDKSIEFEKAVNVTKVMLNHEIEAYQKVRRK